MKTLESTHLYFCTSETRFGQQGLVAHLQLHVVASVKHKLPHYGGLSSI